MSSEWPIVSFGNAPLSIVDGDRGTNYPKQEEFSASGFCLFLNTGNVTTEGFKFNECAFITENKDKLLRKGKLVREDIVLTTRGTLGNVGFYSDKVIHENIRINSGMVILRADKSKLLPYYLFLFLRSENFSYQVKSLKSGSAQPQLPIRDMQRIDIPIPAIEDQEKICSIMASLDDRIALLRETNATLEAIAQAMFKSWFVDFDPVHAKQQGRAPEGMDEATAALFPDSFEESEMGLVPMSWRVGKVADIGEVICGKTPPTSEAANYGDDVPFITIPDMHNLLVITSTNRSLSTLGANTQKKKTLPPGSVCVSCIATAGLVARVTIQSQTNQQINSVVPLAKWGKSFPLFTLRRIGDAVRTGGSGGSTFHNLNKSGFEQLKILFPSELLALAFSEVIEPIIEKITANQLQAQNLATLRDTMLPRLISGQLRLPEAKAVLEEATA